MYNYEQNRSQGERAADSFMAQTLPPHGRHAGPHDIRTTVRDDFSGNGSIVIPARANPSAEVVGNVYEAKIANPLASLRKGRVQAAEGLAARLPDLEDNLVGGFQDARSASAPEYQKKIAYGRSAVANGSDTDSPTWVSARDPEINFDFRHGTACEARPGNIPPLRPGSTPYNHTDLARLDLTSKPAVSYNRIQAPGNRTARPNEAEVTD
jgi:hypothetical protein